MEKFIREFEGKKVAIITKIEYIIVPLYKQI